MAPRGALPFPLFPRRTIMAPTSAPTRSVLPIVVPGQLTLRTIRGAKNPPATPQPHPRTPPAPAPPPPPQGMVRGGRGGADKHAQKGEEKDDPEGGGGVTTGGEGAGSC